MKRRLFPLASVLAALAMLVCPQWRDKAHGATASGKIVYNCGGDICLFDFATSSETQLTFTRAVEANPKLSPDGLTIAFQTGLSGIYLMNVDGTNRRPLSSSGATPVWSPTGSKIAFVDATTPRQLGIWVINVDGSGRMQLASAGQFPAWSPDGCEVAFVNSVLSVVNSNGLNAHAISSQGGLDVAWSPSSKLAFARFVDPHFSYEVYTCEPSICDSTTTRLTTRPKQDFEPTWSPDASMIAWASLATPAGIYVMNAADGSGQTFLISGGRQPSWAPYSTTVSCR